MVPGFDIPKILLVEDNPADAEWVRLTFAEAPFFNDIQIVATGREAMAYLESEPDTPPFSSVYLVFVDRKLPDTEGLSLIKDLSSTFPSRRLFFFVLTGAPVDEVWTFASPAEASVLGYLQKPFSLTSLLSLLQRTSGLGLGFLAKRGSHG